MDALPWLVVTGAVVHPVGLSSLRSRPQEKDLIIVYSRKHWGGGAYGGGGKVRQERGERAQGCINDQITEIGA